MAANRLAWWLYKVTLITLIALLAIVLVWDVRRRSDWQRDAQRHAMENHLSLSLELVRPGRMGELVVVGEETDMAVRAIARAARGQIAVVDVKRTVISASQPTAALRMDSAPDVAMALRGRPGYWETSLTSSGHDALFVSLPLYQHGQVVGAIRLVQSLDPQYRPAGITIGHVLVALFTLAIVAGIVGRLIHRRVDNSLRSLRGAVDACRDGQLQAPAQHDDMAEFEDLSRALNEMAATLNLRLVDLGRQTRQWHALFTSMREGLIAVDRDMHILTINRAAADLLAIPYRDDLMGRSFYEVIRHAELQAFVIELLGPDSAYGEREVQISSSADPHILAITGVHLPDDRGQIKGALVVMRDITRLRQLENMRKEFVANVSHELKTPITSIKGYIETLQDCIGTDPQNAARFVGIIQRQADYLNAIIEDLLYLSRLEQGDPTVYSDFSIGNLRSTIANAVSICTNAAESKGITIQVDCPDLQLRANHRLLEHALTNLLENAVKYSGEDTTIHIDAEMQKERAVFRVTDQGVGISLADQERIFERFYRVDKSRNRKMGGTGLGLAIVKHIVRVHRGTISLESEMGVGSSFIVSLPTQLPATADRLEAVED